MLLSGKMFLCLGHILAVLINNYRKKKSNEELAKLIDRSIKQRDENAFREIYQYCEPLLVRYIFVKIGNQQEAEDILHNCLLVLLEGKYDYTKSKLLTYLSGIANNEISNYQKKERKHKTTENNLKILTNLISNETPIKKLEEQELQKVVNEAVASLSPILGDTYKLYQLTDEGHSLSQIAELLGISNTALTSRLTEIRKHLKDRLSQYLE